MNNYRVPTYQRFEWINHAKVRRILERFLRPPKRGRKGYDKVTMFLWLMYKQVMGCSYRDLESITGIDYSTFIKFRKRLMQRRWFSSVFNRLAHLLTPHLKQVAALLDSSFVETYSHRDEDGSGYSGYKEKNGFKLHSLIDFTTRLPLVQRTSPGNEADITHGKRLLDRAPPALSVRGFAADKGYDSEYFVMDIKHKWRRAGVAIPVRRMRQSGDPQPNLDAKHKDRSYDRSLYKKRTEIERYFSRKKRVFRLGEEKTRHLENFRANCYLTSIMEILEWLTNHPEVSLG